MLLIYVSAKDDNQENDGSLPGKDLQPVMLALTYKGDEYILREASSHGIASSKPPEFKSVKRLFVSKEPFPDEKGKPEESKEKEEAPDEDDEDALLEENAKNAQMAVALATIVFRAGECQPIEVDYVEHVKKRIKLADKLVVAGYTDPECTMAESESLGLRRAIAVRDTLLAGNIDLPIVAISRPKCCYAGDHELSRRVEITALFFGSSGPPEDSLDEQHSFEEGDEPKGSTNKSAQLVTVQTRAIQ